MKKSNSIFRQLILNVITPVVIAIFILGALNYYQTMDIMVDSNKSKNKIISDEIKHIMSFQDYSLELIEETMDKEMEGYSQMIVNNYFSTTDSIETADFYRIRKELNMDEKFHDIYIINANGEVVNTTFKKDLGLNFFDFGELHKNKLLGILNGTDFVSERFSIESSTNHLKKYTYQPTNDGKYIVELGFYSNKATHIVDSFKNHLNSIESQSKSIVSIDMFIGEDNPISFNRAAKISEENKQIIEKVFREKNGLEIQKTENDKDFHYEYIYMDRKGTDLYKGAVIRIISDTTEHKIVLRNELIELLAIFAVTILIVVFLIYKKTRVITFPIKKLVENVTRITEGNLHERAEVEGSNEITNLSMKFNQMVERLEESYSFLEQKVVERTAEIQHQKLEIEEQNKHIMDSIYYARRIQTAILPANDYVKTHLPEAFLLYKPKDIVSGDFYWMTTIEDEVLIAAVDCTGHGVPGAFMSIIGHNQLNHAVNVEKAHNPGKILDCLNVGVTNALNQQQSHTGIKDGMDIALCKINFEKSEVEFAGAYNPLYVITNNETTIAEMRTREVREYEFNNYYLFEIKGDKSPIGNFVGEELATYNNHTIPLQKGDAIYIFSDGFADQFGGPKGKKFRYKNFKEVLLANQGSSMATQQTILNQTIEGWRGDLEQIDDILVIGIQL